MGCITTLDRDPLPVGKHTRLKALSSPVLYTLLVIMLQPSETLLHNFNFTFLQYIEIYGGP